MRLVLRRGTVVEADVAPAAGEQRIVVEIDSVRRPAVADVTSVGASEVGDDVVVNGQAVDLRLGSGGFDIVHVNLTRGLGGPGVPGAHVMKLNYSSLQHAVLPVEEELPETERAPEPEHRGRVGVFGLHGQLAPIAWAIAQARTGRAPLRVGYVQTAGGALPGGHSRVVTDLLERGLLAGHLTAGPTYGGRDGEAITTIGGIDHAVQQLGWDIVLCGPGPGILGSGSRLGHGGMTALDTAHAALALGHEVVLCARMSAGDPRERHRGLSHHTQTVVDLLLAPVTVPLPYNTVVGSSLPRCSEPLGEELARATEPPGEVALHTWVPERPGKHGWPALAVDLPGYAASGLPARTMGRSSDEDPIFFQSALACGTYLAGDPSA